MSLIDVPADRAEWLEMRKHYIGGSEIAGLIVPDQVPAYVPSPYAMWAEKSGVYQPKPIDTGRTRFGTRMEAVVADEIAEMTGWQYREGVYAIDDTTPGMGCTLDRLVTNDPRGPGCLEIKVVSWQVYRQSWINDRPPFISTIQLCHQMACSGTTWGAVGALILGSDHVPQIHDFTPRQGITDSIHRTVDEFWRRVRDNNPYPLDYKPSTADALRDMFPAVIDEQPFSVEGDPEADEICTGRLTGDADIKGAQRHRDEFQNRLIGLCAGHDWVRTDMYDIRKAANKNQWSIRVRKA